MRNNDKRKSMQAGATIFAALLIFSLCAAASALFAAYQRKNIDGAIASWRSWRPATTPNPEAPQKKKRLRSSKKPLVLTAALAKPTITFADASLSLAQTFALTDFCAELRNALPNLQLEWKPNLLFSDTSDCASALPSAPRDDDTSHNSFFAQVTRNAFGASTMVRLKLVYLPGNAEKTFRTDFEHAAGAALARLVQGDAGTLMQNVRNLQPFDIELRNVRIRLFEEKLFAGAFNLTMEANCGKYRCPLSSATYKLSMPAVQTAALPQQD